MTDINEKIVFGERLNKIYEDILPHLLNQAEREGTATGGPDDGKEPFVDAFRNHPDDDYVVCLAHGIVDSWLVTRPEIRERDYFVGVTRPSRKINEHFSWGICIDDDHPLKTSGKEEDAALLARMCPLGRDYKYEHGGDVMGAEEFRLAETVVGLWWTCGYQGHTVPNYPNLLSLGIGGIVKKIDENDEITNPHDTKRKNFYAACRIVMNGMSDMLKMYANLAKDMAKTAESPWKEELLEIEKTCRAVSWDAPKTLREAGQLMWIYCLWDWVDCVGRFDQYMYPFYKTAGEDRDELISALVLKFWENGVHNLTVGGVKPEDGTDATNEISYVCLQTIRTLHDTHPRMTLRIHENTPKDIIDLVVLMWSEGMSDPSIASDEVAVPGLVGYGVPIEDARDYSLLGCQEIEIPGKSNFGCEDGSVNLAKILEYTLCHGHDRKYETKIGLDLGGTTDYKTFDDLWNAYVKEVQYITRMWCEITNYGVDIRNANVAKLVKSCTTDSCIERGLNLDAGGSIYNYGVVETAGHAAVSDSLFAMKKLVYDEKKITLEELEAALAANFEGYEEIRQMLRGVPKLGNNDPECDEMAVKVLDQFWTEIGKYTSRRGGVFTGACSLLESGIGFGKCTGPLPDGRFAGEPLGNTIGPRTGSDKSGLTAMLSSVAKLPLQKGVGGTTCNVLIPTYITKTPEMRDNIGALMKTFMLTGGLQAQVTTASLEDMKDAQVHPEDHEDLIVRVGGFSRKFIEFDKEVQDEFILRYGT